MKQSLKMKQQLKIQIGLLLSFALVVGSGARGQDSIEAEPSIAIRYFVQNNNLHYLTVQTRFKVGKKFQPIPAQAFEVFLDSISKENLIAKTVTNNHGNAKVLLPPSLKSKWDNSATHSFIAIAAVSGVEITSTLDITKARILLDTSTVESVRTVNVTVEFFKDNIWMPAADVEMKVGINRLAGILSAGEDATYTTDSTGTLSVDFTREQLPGDANSNLVLVAKVEDNEIYGNLVIEKAVPWGIAAKSDLHFFEQRTLWSTRTKTPVWLLFMAYGMVSIVWGVIIYLIIALIKIKKLGKDNERLSKDIPKGAYTVTRA